MGKCCLFMEADDDEQFYDGADYRLNNKGVKTQEHTSIKKYFGS